jgi:hypothetical protein
MIRTIFTLQDCSCVHSHLSYQCFVINDSNCITMSASTILHRIEPQYHTYGKEGSQQKITLPLCGTCTLILCRHVGSEMYFHVYEKSWVASSLRQFCTELNLIRVYTHVNCITSTHESSKLGNPSKSLDGCGNVIHSVRTHWFRSALPRVWKHQLNN